MQSTGENDIASTTVDNKNYTSSYTNRAVCSLFFTLPFTVGFGSDKSVSD